MRISVRTTDLLLVDLESVTVLHLELFTWLASVFVMWKTSTAVCAGVCATHHLRVVCGVDSGAIEEEAHAGGRLALTLTEGVHELLELSGTLDLEEHLVVVVGDLDVQVLGLLGSFVLVARRRRRGRLRHRGGCVAIPFATGWSVKG